MKKRRSFNDWNVTPPEAVDASAMKLTHLRRLDMRRNPHAVRGRGPDSDLNAAEIPTAVDGRADGASVLPRFEDAAWPDYQNELCKRENDAPENLAKPGRYFWDARRRCLIDSAGDPIGSRSLRK
jgi:hypothetical protein